MSRAGERVGAISHSDGGKIFLFGFGVYVGDEVPDSAGGFIGESIREQQRTNPKIVLDNGKVVWGCECWWGPEEEVKKQIEGKEAIEIDIDTERMKHE